MPRRLLAHAAIVVAALVSGVPVSSAELESPPGELAARDVVPSRLLSSANHHVGHRVTLVDNLLRMEVRTDFGLYDVVSIALLEIRVHELAVLAEAIEQYEQRTRVLAGEGRGGLRIPEDADVQVLSPPTGPGRNISSELSRNDAILAARGARRAPPSDSRAPPPESVASGPVFESHRRNVAYQLGLDPYSTNPPVRDFLVRVADARAKGRFSAGSGLVLRPERPAVRRVAGGRIDQEVRHLLRHVDPEELEAGLASELVRIGASDAVVGEFLEHPHYTPRLRASIAAHIDFLAPADGREAILAAALGARDYAEALSYEQLTRMLAVYHADVSAIERLLPGGASLPGALRVDGGLVLLLPVDYVYWTEAAQRTFDSLRSADPMKSGRPVELVVRGTLSARARSELALRGVEVREGFLYPR